MSKRARILKCSLFIVSLLLIWAIVGFAISYYSSNQQNLFREFQNVFPGAFDGVIQTLGAALGFVVGRYIYDDYKKPILEIEGIDELKGPQQKWVRIIVKNRGHTAAENCVGHINISGRFSNGEEIDIKGNVCWSIIGNPNSVIINVDSEHTLDIYRFLIRTPDPNLFEVPTEAGWKSIRGSISINDFAENAQIEITITSKNAKSCSENYILEFKVYSVSISPAHARR